MNNQQLRAVAYLRTASADHDDQQAALVAQHERCLELAASVGAETVAIYADRGQSGRNPIRQGLACLLDHLQRERIDVVIAADRARLARDPRLLAELEAQIEGSGATLLTEEPGVYADAA